MNPYNSYFPLQIAIVSKEVMPCENQEFWKQHLENFVLSTWQRPSCNKMECEAQTQEK